MRLGVVSFVTASTALGSLQTTAETVLSQMTDPRDDFVWIVSCEESRTPDVTSYLGDLGEDPRVRVSAVAPRTGGDAYRPLSRIIIDLNAELDAIRFLECGHRLLPGALACDLEALQKWEWTASVALDDFGGMITRPALTASPGPVPQGAYLDEWAHRTPQLTIHPLTMAVRTDLAKRVVPCSLTYGEHCELLARINQIAEGWFRTRPTVVIPAAVPPSVPRPTDFYSQRMAVIEKLRARSLSNTVQELQESGPALWESVSDTAWDTREVGHETDLKADDTLRDVLVQARKYHYRFDWWQLSDYAGQGLQRWPSDAYLRAMYLTACAAAEQSREHWSRCAYFVSQHENPKIIHLFLTSVFESASPSAAVLQCAVQLAHSLVPMEGENPVLYYRLASFYRRLGYVSAARANADLATQKLRDAAPALADHLRERLLLEKSLLSVIASVA